MRLQTEVALDLHAPWMEQEGGGLPSYSTQETCVAFSERNPSDVHPGIELFNHGQIGHFLNLSGNREHRVGRSTTS